MRRWAVLFVLAGVLAGCSGKATRVVGADAAVGEARVGHKRAPWVAYEHALELEVPVGQTREVMNAVQGACAALPERGCTLLETSVSGGADAGAVMRMRVVPDGVNKVLRALDGRGKVMSQSSKGQDLAQPIEDGGRKMGMLTAYRDQLQTLARQRALDADALIKLHRELAEVQSQIEQGATAQAQLRRRVDTELLSVMLHEHAKGGQIDRVRQAVDDFGADLLHGVALLITFVASTIPFALAGTVGYVGWRRVRVRPRGSAPSKEESR